MAASSVTSALISIATSAATASGSSLIATPSLLGNATTKPSKDENNGECQLLGPFAIVVQTALGLLALSSLVFKRWRERPQRPVKVWAFDASKQVFGSALLHLANLLMSMFSSGQLGDPLINAAANTTSVDVAEGPNPCSFYLLNLGIDTTLGIPILICILKVLNVGASYTPLARPPESIKSGNYGTPPKATWWLKQSFIYFAGLVGMKICVFIIFQLCPWIVQVGDWALRWTEGNEAIQIAFVMLIFPLIMNGIQYYIIDIFIKNKDQASESEQQDSERDDGNDEEGGLLAGQEERHTDIFNGDDGVRQSEEDVKGNTTVRSKESIDSTKEVHAGGEGSGSSSIGQEAEGEAIKDRPRI
ncbi:Vacuolar membrane protein [Cyphellophora attinorum]|uniref:Vacuolar membrane protein n=1 Tax=Cyphellophora attinorum TaxID=1664694 RepID=A0A0N1P0E9_9EURO|nr:Vacuolar membrane protein [Phialophora attinorum]KPI40194.1 Vacuolar membrane protein [Phialophora attinorum]